MARMSTRSWSARIALWAAVCALLLKSAVPLLASVAAMASGQAVGDVCPVYGVVLASSSAGGIANGSIHRHAGAPSPQGAHDHAAHLAHAKAHGQPNTADDGPSHTTRSDHGDHCALTALAALALPDLQTAPLPAADTMRVASAEHPSTTAAQDECARWVARLKHGPPTLA
jgi:hypothetical protein